MAKRVKSKVLRFYKDTLSFEGFNDLKVNNGTTYVTVPTPKGWKCKCKGCKVDYRHSHGTFTSLIKENGQNKKSVPKRVSSPLRNK